MDAMVPCLVMGNFVNDLGFAEDGRSMLFLIVPFLWWSTIELQLKQAPSSPCIEALQTYGYILLMQHAVLVLGVSHKAGKTQM